MKFRRNSIFFGIVTLLSFFGGAKASALRLLATEFLESQAPRRALHTISRTEGFKPLKSSIDLDPKGSVEIILPKRIKLLDATGEIYKPILPINQSNGFATEGLEKPEVQIVDDSAFVDLKKK